MEIKSTRLNGGILRFDIETKNMATNKIKTLIKQIDEISPFLDDQQLSSMTQDELDDLDEKILAIGDCLQICFDETGSGIGKYDMNRRGACYSYIPFPYIEELGGVEKAFTQFMGMPARFIVGYDRSEAYAIDGRLFEKFMEDYNNPGRQVRVERRKLMAVAPAGQADDAIPGRDVKTL